MKKGMIFAGCSFTWGQGLYYYSNMSTLRQPAPEQYDFKLVTHAHKRFMASLRYPRLVANHFGTFELVKKEMGSAYPLKAPLSVNIGFGVSWHAAEH